MSTLKTFSVNKVVSDLGTIEKAFASDFAINSIETHEMH
jgi:hypothetical protein